MLENHPDHAATHFGGKLVRRLVRHGSILSRVGASGKPGAVQVILYDGWWNPAVEAQAIDRVHHIGQHRPVFVHRLIATDTVEEEMEILKRRKADLVKSLWDAVANADDAIAEGGTPAFTEEDIDTLFGAEDLM